MTTTERRNPTGNPIAHLDAETIGAAVDANVRRVVAQLTADPSLSGAVCNNRLTIIGARYELETGAVVAV